MTLPRVRAIAGGRAGRRCAGAGLLVLAVLIGVVPARADERDDPYSATVKVDATADTVVEARKAARLDGQRRALAAVVDRLSGAADSTKLPKLDDKAVTDLVDSFEVANEHMSAVRYLADYTFHFRASKVKRLLRSADIAIAEPGGKPVVVIPVYRNADTAVLWDDPNAWREAWAQHPAGSGPTRLVVPLGGVDDLSTIDAEQALSGQSDPLAAIAQRNGADDAIVAAATARRQRDRLTGLEVSLKRYHLGQPVDSRSKTLTADSGESEGDFLKQAVDATAADIEHRAPAAASEHRAPVAADQQAVLDAVVPIASLGDWVGLRNRLAAVPAIRKVALLSLSRREAKIEIRYVGTADALKSSLAEAALDLGGGDPVWRLSPSGAAGLR